MFTNQVWNTLYWQWESKCLIDKGVIDGSQDSVEVLYIGTMNKLQWAQTPHSLVVAIADFLPENYNAWNETKISDACTLVVLHVVSLIDYIVAAP